MAWSPFGGVSKDAQNATMNEYERPCRVCHQIIAVGARMVPYRTPYSTSGAASLTPRVWTWQHLECATKE
jgi:deoxycytidylate deaminase